MVDRAAGEATARPSCRGEASGRMVDHAAPFRTGEATARSSCSGEQDARSTCGGYSAMMHGHYEDEE